MLLNCDLGESYGTRQVGDDAAVMPLLDQASIACGLHGGDPLTLRRTIALAIAHGVSIGAHPSYADREGFGRRSMDLTADEIVALLHYQVAALEGMVTSAGASLCYVKPHGALYNDMMTSAAVREAIMTALASYHTRYPLMLQATPDWQSHRAEADRHGLQLLFEAFADRRYTTAGTLQSRSEVGAVLDREDILNQVAQLLCDGQVTTDSGDALPVHAQTLCIHGDNPEAVAATASIRALIDAG